MSVDIQTILPTEHFFMFEGAGTYTIRLPATLVGNRIVFGGATAPGGGGGAGQSGAGLAGGGGGGAGQALAENTELVCSPNDVLTFTIGTQGQGGVVGGAAATDGGTLTVVGATTPNSTASPFEALLGGGHGLAGGGVTTGVGGVGGAGKGQGLGAGGTAGGGTGVSVTAMFGRLLSSPGGGGGASTGGPGGTGGSTPNFAPQGGGGTNGGGTGASGWWGKGVQGSADNTNANPNPAFIGWGGGGAGGGSNGNGGPGAPGTIKGRYWS